MKISTKSWHMRLARFLQPSYKPRNLCQHFWMIVGMTLFGLVAGAAVIVCLPGIAAGALLYGIWEGGKWLRNKLLKRESRPPKPPGLLVSYLKAKKEKFCPLTELEDEEPWRAEMHRRYGSP